MEIETKCKDFGEVGCLGTPDPKFTMHFDDIGEEALLFCSFCGARAFSMKAIFEDWLQDEKRTKEELLSLRSKIEAVESESLADKN